MCVGRCLILFYLVVLIVWGGVRVERSVREGGRVVVLSRVWSRF